MINFALAVFTLTLTSGAPALAQAPVNPPAPRDAQAVQSLSIDTPIEIVAADPAGRMVLERDTPGLLEHPMYDSFKSMSLKAVAPLSEGKITDGVLAKAQGDLSALKRASSGG